MDNDNVYPNNGTYFTLKTPKEQAEDSKQQVQHTLAQLPLLEKIVKHLDERIAFYSSVDSVPAEFLTNPEAFMHTVTANKLTRDNLIAERGYIQTQIAKTAKRR